MSMVLHHWVCAIASDRSGRLEYQNHKQFPKINDTLLRSSEVYGIAFLCLKSWPDWKMFCAQVLVLFIFVLNSVMMIVCVSV